MSGGVRNGHVQGSRVQTFPSVRDNQRIQGPLLIYWGKFLNCFHVTIRFLKVIVGCALDWFINGLGPVRKTRHQLLSFLIPRCLLILANAVQNPLWLDSHVDQLRNMLVWTDVLSVVVNGLGSILSHFKVSRIHK